MVSWAWANGLRESLISFSTMRLSLSRSIVFALFTVPANSVVLHCGQLYPDELYHDSLYLYVTGPESLLGSMSSRLEKARQDGTECLGYPVSGLYGNVRLPRSMELM
jgi:hypothetical protein